MSRPRGVAPSLSVVVVAYQAEDLLGACLGSLEGGRDGAVEVVVVDNASTDGTARVVRDHPWARLLRSPTNLGFAGGCDAGVAATSAEWVLLLNPDAALAPGALDDLLLAAGEQDDEVAVHTARVLLADRFVEAPDGPVVGPRGRYAPDPAGPVRLVNSTGNVVRRDGYGVDRGWLEPADDHAPGRDVFGFCGAAALVRRIAWDRLGGMDETFFLYYEDTDLSWRLRLTGWTVRYRPGATVLHQHSASAVEGSDLAVLHNERNRLLVLVRCAPATVALRAVARFPLTTARWTLQRRPDPRATGLRLRAGASFLRLLPRALAERRRLTAAGATPTVRRGLHATFPGADEAPGGGYRSS